MTNADTENLERKRAIFAYREVLRWGATWREKAVNEVMGLPIALRTQGLLVTIATLMNRDPVPHGELANLIARWVLIEVPGHPLEAWNTFESNRPECRLLHACLEADRPSYLAAQAEALAILEKIKLLADALSTQPSQK